MIQPLLLAAAQRLRAAGIDEDEARVEARILLARALDISANELWTLTERLLTSAQAAAYDALIARRAAREPLAYITGEREFYGLTFAVSSAALVPRPETEFVVEMILRHVVDRPSALIADVGTGSGCIAVAVAANAEGVQLVATDLSKEALALAQQNAEGHNVAHRVRFVFGDALVPLEAFAPLNVIASNPPYIAPEEIRGLEPEVRDWEPRIALGTHADPLHFYGRFADGAPALLAPGGALIVEVGQGQADAVADLWRQAGLIGIEIVPDYAGIARVVAGITGS